MQAADKERLRLVLNDIGEQWGRQEPFREAVIESYFVRLLDLPLAVVKQALLNLLKAAGEQRLGVEPMPFPLPGTIYDAAMAMVYEPDPPTPAQVGLQAPRAQESLDAIYAELARQQPQNVFLQGMMARRRLEQPVAGTAQEPRLEAVDG